jgi:hypothetical protein
MEESRQYWLLCTNASRLGCSGGACLNGGLGFEPATLGEQTARYLVKALLAAREGKSQAPSVKYLENAEQEVAARSPVRSLADWQNPEMQVAALRSAFPIAFQHALLSSSMHSPACALTALSVIYVAGLPTRLLRTGTCVNF